MQVGTNKNWSSYTQKNIDFKTKTVVREKQGLHVITEASIQHEDTTFVNLGAPKYIKKILI